MKKFNIVFSKCEEHINQIVIDSCYENFVTDRMFDIVKDICKRSNNISWIVIGIVNNYPSITIDNGENQYKIAPFPIHSVEDLSDIIDNNI